jgi:hypothetical protein
MNSFREIDNLFQSLRPQAASSAFVKSIVTFHNQIFTGMAKWKMVRIYFITKIFVVVKVLYYLKICWKLERYSSCAHSNVGICCPRTWL